MMILRGKSDFELWELLHGFTFLSDSPIGITRFDTLKKHHSDERKFKKVIEKTPDQMRAKLVAVVSDLSTRGYDPGSLDSLRQQLTFRQKHGMSEGLHTFFRDYDIPPEASRVLIEDGIQDEYDLKLLTSLVKFDGW